jgi:hypothetical protein
MVCLCLGKGVAHLGGGRCFDEDTKSVCGSTSMGHFTTLSGSGHTEGRIQTVRRCTCTDEAMTVPPEVNKRCTLLTGADEAVLTNLPLGPKFSPPSILHYYYTAEQDAALSRTRTFLLDFFSSFELIGT